jgi:cellulose synthase/poly-beta-1,6-N-acetylglucosamine synthase-like glycosyltransferase
MRCLAGIGRTVLDAEAVEVVVAGDGGDVAKPPEGAAGAVPVRFTGDVRRGPAAARNRGARAARGNLIAFIDDDCVPTPEWLPALLGGAERRPEALLAGRVRNGLPANRWAEASHTLLDVVIDTYNRRAGTPGFAPSSNLALRREVFDEVGGFDERFPRAAAEDRELCDRAFELGHPLVHVPAAVVDHFHDLDLRSFIRQHANDGRGTATYREVTIAGGRRPNAVQKRFYRRLLVATVRAGPAAGAPGRTLRVALSQVVYVAAYLAARSRGAAG